MRTPLLMDSSPLTTGLVDVVLPVGGVMISLAGTLAQQAFVDTNSPTMGFNKTQKTPAKSYVAASTQYSLRTGAPAPFNVSANTLKECSILVLWTSPAALVANGTIFGYGNSASANPLFQVVLGATSKFTLSVRNTANTTTQSTAGTATIATSTDYCLIGTRSESNSYHRTYVNGVVDVDAAPVAITAASFDRATVGALQRVTLSGASGGQVALVLVWNRALTPGEAAALSANPWQVFAQPTLRVRSDIIAAGGNVTVALTGTAATAAVGTLGVSLSAALSGNAGTSAAGTVGRTSLVTIGLTGGSATGAVGNVDLAGDKTIALTGNQAASALGSLAYGVAKGVSGNSATSACGTLARTSLVTISLSGVQGASGVGTITASGGNTSLWTPATIDTQSWTAATPDSQVWTPATNDTQSWTPQ